MNYYGQTYLKHQRSVKNFYSLVVRAREGVLEDVMHSSRAALFSPLQLWGNLRQELISSLLKNCAIIRCLGRLTRNEQLSLYS